MLVVLEQTYTCLLIVHILYILKFLFNFRIKMAKPNSNFLDVAVISNKETPSKMEPITSQQLTDSFQAMDAKGNYQNFG